MANYTDHHAEDYEPPQDCFVDRFCGMDYNDWLFEESLRNLENQ